MIGPDSFVIYPHHCAVGQPPVLMEAHAKIMLVYVRITLLAINVKQTVLGIFKVITVKIKTIIFS